MNWRVFSLTTDGQDKPAERAEAIKFDSKSLLPLSLRQDYFVLEQAVEMFILAPVCEIETLSRHGKSAGEPGSVLI